MSLKNYKKPDFTLKEARTMAAKAFALVPEKIKPLPGDRSQNFLVTVKTGKKYVLKISSSFDQPEELDFENKVILKLSQELSDYHFPLPQPDVNGQFIIPYESQNEIFYLRLFDYLEGLSLSELKSVPPSLWPEIGRLLARIDLVLKDFYHAGSKRELPWDVKNALWSKDRLKYLTDPVKRRQERLWRTVKYEEVYLHDYRTVQEARERLAAYFRFYNNERLHEALGYRTPHEVYFGTLAAQKSSWEQRV